jgi:hypothetical protein
MAEHLPHDFDVRAASDGEAGGGVANVLLAPGPSR